MMSSNGQEPGQGELTPAQHRQMEQRQSDQDRTLLAMQQLEAALGAAAPRRERAWHSEVRSALAVLGEAASSEAKNAEQPESLLSDIARTQPWLRNRVRGLRIQYRQLQASIASLQSELEEPTGSAVDFADIRQRLAWILTGFRHQRARESDLIYEAYYDAFRSDITLDAGNAPGGR
ncbi:MAG TPA: hypothetical protein VE733_17810 [Streptosporangiaceae bacterium]|nr:hypothetical protein [Streptosporangiaceae bacterium]